MAARADLADYGGIFASIAADDEERGGDIVSGEQIEEARSHAWIRAIVKCKCDAIFRATLGQIVQYGTKYL